MHWVPGSIPRKLSEQGQSWGKPPARNVEQVQGNIPRKLSDKGRESVFFIASESVKNNYYFECVGFYSVNRCLSLHILTLSIVFPFCGEQQNMCNV
jgi:hypothetical protein